MWTCCGGFCASRALAVEHVMNVTDVDDKIIRNALAAKQPIGEYTARFEKAFFEDMAALGIERPEHVPRATEHIAEMVTLIERLAAERHCVPDGGWELVLPHRAVSGLRQALQKRFGGDGGTARG